MVRLEGSSQHWNKCQNLEQFFSFWAQGGRICPFYAINHCIKGPFVKLEFSAVLEIYVCLKKKKSEAVELDGWNLCLDTTQIHGLTAGCVSASVVLPFWSQPSMSGSLGKASKKSKLFQFPLNGWKSEHCQCFKWLCTNIQAWWEENLRELKCAISPLDSRLRLMAFGNSACNYPKKTSVFSTSSFLFFTTPSVFHVNSPFTCKSLI